MQIQQLWAEIDRLGREAWQLHDQGTMIRQPDFWLDQTSNGKTSKVYYRKRWFDEQGRKQAESISQETYVALKAAILRGKKLNRIEKKLNKLKQQLCTTETRIKQYGATVPHQTEQVVEWTTAEEWGNLDNLILRESYEEWQDFDRLLFEQFGINSSSRSN